MAVCAAAADKMWGSVGKGCHREVGTVVCAVSKETEQRG